MASRLPPDEFALSAPGPYAAETGSAEPPWVQAMQRSLVLMHKKQDMRLECECISLVLNSKRLRSVFKSWKKWVRSTAPPIELPILRMDALERELQALRNQVSRETEVSRARSPTAQRGYAVRDRSPGPQSRSPRDVEGELQLVMGGWQQARQADAEAEVRQAFDKGGSRTQFMMFTWISKQRSREERNKIKAIVSMKDFAERYAASMPGKNFEAPEPDCGAVFTWEGATSFCMLRGQSQRQRTTIAKMRRVTIQDGSWNLIRVFLKSGRHPWTSDECRRNSLR